MAYTGYHTMGSVVAPTLGAIFTTFMWLSPMVAVLEARKIKSLHLSTGPLNPIPLAITFINCIAWCTYACQRRDYFILAPNGTGLALGMFYVMSVLPCMDKGLDGDPDEEDSESALLALEEERKLKLTVEAIIVSALAFWTLVFMAVFIVLDPSQAADNKAGQMVVSSLGVTVDILYYGSPLTTMRTVVKTRNGESLYLPMIFMNLVTAMMWVVYGLVGRPDPMVWAPNFIGVLLAVAQIILALWYHPIHPLRRLVMAVEAAAESCMALMGVGDVAKGGPGGTKGEGAADDDDGPAGRIADQHHSVTDGLGGSVGKRGSGSPGRSSSAGSGKSTASSGSGGGGTRDIGVGALGDVDTEVIIQYSDEEQVIHSPLWGTGSTNN